MNIYCVTGVPGIDLTGIAEILSAGGISPPTPSRQDGSLTFSTWHDRVVAPSARNGVEAPGRLWDQLASSLFLANMDHADWYWADGRSVWLLDYWKQFEPNIRFVLLYASPQEAIANQLASGHAANFDATAALETWESATKEMLRFHLRNQERSLLVNAWDCMAHAQAFIDAVQPGAARTAMARAAPVLPPLALHLAEDVVKSQPRVRELDNEVCASITALRPLDDAAIGAKENAPLGRAMQDYVAMLGAASAASQHQKVHAEEIAALTANLTIKQQEIDKATQAANSSAEEAELLLKQLHQVQEELERQLLKHEDEATKGNKKLAELDKQLAKERAANAVHEKKLTDLNATLAERDKQLKAAEAKLKDFGPEQKKREAETRAKLEAAVAEKQKEIDASARAAKEETDLLLHQLHQVQEELEHYFLKHRDAANQLKQLEDRWQRMLEKNPSYAEFRTAELLEKTDDGKRTTLLFKDLIAGGQSFTELRVALDTTAKSQGFEIQTKEGAPPVSLHDLAALSTSNWALVRALTHTSRAALALPEVHGKLSDAARVTILNALTQIDDAAEAMPPVLRFDDVDLKREQTNPDYEHLWFSVRKLSFGHHHIDDFEFRISCGNVSPKRFGTHPKLEFPEGAGAGLFEKWFAESSDDFGDKFELRFALPDGMDVGVWNTLTATDQNALSALVGKLPAMMARLEQTKLRRALADWNKMVNDIQRIYGMHAVRVSGVAA